MSLCRVCDNPLVIEVEADGDDFQSGPGSSSSSAAAGPEESVPDDLTLSCGCHFHWECLFENASTIASNGARCPVCSTPLADAAPADMEAFIQAPPPMLSVYLNEGGLDPSLALGPLLAEEAFFSAQPLARQAKAFHLMAAEGDIAGLLDMLRDMAEEMDPVQIRELLCYQDPLNGRRSALHVAVQNRQEDVSWLLLWVASALGNEYFPEFSVSVAREMGLGRLEVSTREQDIRYLRDSEDKTSEDVAREAEFAALLQPGTLTPP
ncbi:hypothetical protein BROUX41_002260 [Berkeleyomyces rouxiae]